MGSEKVTPLVADADSQASAASEGVAQMDTIIAPPLNLADRCDRCSAQAFVRTIMPGGGDLLWCGHHFSRHELVLTTQALQIQDERKNINAKPSISANAV